MYFLSLLAVNELYGRRQKHAVCCRYQNRRNWHEHLRGHEQNLMFINYLASEVGVIGLWDSINREVGVIGLRDSINVWHQKHNTNACEKEVWAMSNVAWAYGASKVPPQQHIFLKILISREEQRPYIPHILQNIKNSFDPKSP